MFTVWEKASIYNGADSTTEIITYSTQGVEGWYERWGEEYLYWHVLAYVMQRWIRNMIRMHDTFDITQKEEAVTKTRPGKMFTKEIQTRDLSDAKESRSIDTVAQKIRIWFSLAILREG
jgi:hypothetical protein